MRHTTILLTATACLALAGCSSADGGDDKPTPSAPASAASSPSPELSKSEARQACVDAWYTVMREQGEATVDDKPPVCDGLTGQAGLYWEALQRRNEGNRARLEECLEDPSCTEFPVP